MVTPSWVRTRIQPIAVRDVLRSLVGSAAMPRRRQPGLRHRRPGRADVPGDDAPLRRGRRAAARGSSCRCRCSPPACPATGSAWSRPCPRRSPGRSPSRCGTRWSATSTTSPGTCPTRPGRPIGFDEARRLALRRVRDARGRHPLVVRRRCPGAPSDPLPTDPDWAGGSLYTDDRELAGRRPARGAVAGDRGHRRRERLVLLPARLGGARLAGPAGRRGGAAPRPPGRRAGCGSATRWTSGGSRRSSPGGCCGCGPRCGCRAWPGWRCTRDRTPDGPDPLPPARPVPSARAARPRLLVERGALPRGGLRRHGPQHRPGGRGAGAGRQARARALTRRARSPATSPRGGCVHRAPPPGSSSSSALRRPGARS